VAIGKSVKAQATLLAFGDAFYLMGIAIVLALLAAVLMRKTSGGGAGAH
jgi:DHA2 family multidrug resistance protein